VVIDLTGARAASAGAAAAPVARPEAVMASVTADLVAADSGVEFVYRSLDRLRERSNAEDIVVIVDEPTLGRQAFRAGRKPIETSWAREIVRSGAPGVHSIPTAVDAAVGSCVAQLCGLALRLDVARHDSLHDPLTGLLNRRAFDEHLAAACAQARRYGWTFAVALLDLDGFKSLNDKLGHVAGDEVLKAVGTELRQNLRVGDAAARVGGDEFALVLPNMDREVLVEILGRIEEAVRETLAGTPMSWSVGFANAPEDALDADLLYRLADQRLYERKRRR